MLPRRVLAFLAFLTCAAAANTAAQSWTQFTPIGQSPSPTNAALVPVYDPSSNRLISFGGLTYCCTAYNGVWVLSNANGQGGAPQWTTLAPAGPQGFPSPRGQHSAVYDTANNRMIIFGGGRFNGNLFSILFNDTWVLTNANGLTGTPTWLPLNSSGGPPAGRAGHRAVYDQTTNRMIVFGGGNNGIMSVPNDVWVLTNANGLGGTPQWVQLNPTGQIPPPTEAFAAEYDPINNVLTIFGGCCSFNNNSYTLSNANGLGGTPQWTQLTPAGTLPSARGTWVYGYNPGRNQLLVFGLGAFNVSVNDFWTLSNANGLGGTPAWSNPIPNGDPGAPPANDTLVGGVYDPVSDRLMLLRLGPDVPQGQGPQLWVLNTRPPAGPPAWAQLNPSGGPPPQRKFHSTIYDPLSNRLIIFGGCAAGTCQQGQPTLNDVWVLTNADGSTGPSTWVQLNPPGGPPPPRHSHVGVYDPGTNTMIIWSGDSSFLSLPDLSDVWVLTNANGLNRNTGLATTSQWIQLFPLGQPASLSAPGREQSAGIYDPVSNRMIIFGGASCGPCTTFNDVWVLTNANGSGGTPQWIQLFPTGGQPSPRIEHTVVYDGSTDRMILLGGGNNSVLNDTWVLINVSGIDRTTRLPVTPQWIQLPTTGGPPAARGFHAAAYDSTTNQMIIFGGSSGFLIGPAGPTPFNDVWILTNANGTGSQTPTWSQLSPSGTLPANRAVFGHRGLYNPFSDTMLVYGGVSDLSPAAITYQDSWVLKNAISGSGTGGPRPVTHTLTVASTNPSNGVAISVTPSDNNGQGNGNTQFTRTYNDGAAVTLGASAVSGGNNFSSWTGCDSTSGANCTVTMNVDLRVIANYVIPTPGMGNDPTTAPAFASEPINTGNGNYFYQHTDFVIAGRGMPLFFQRSYNTLDNYSGPLGASWTHNFNVLLRDDSTSVAIKWGDGHGETFTLSGGNYVSQPGVFSTLTKNPDGTFVLTRKDQIKYVFSTAGKLTSVQDKNGNTILLTYTTSGNLSQITDTAGRNLAFSYDGSNRITQITDPVGRTALFQYNLANDLVQATDPAGGITTFAYDANHRVTSITQPNGQTLLQNTYDSSGRVTSQTGGRGFSTTLAYSTPNPRDTTITDARGHQTIHSYDSSLRIIKITDAAAGIVSFAYDAHNDRTSVTNQNGKITNFTYDGQGNVTGITDPLTNAVAFTYDAKNNLLTATNAKAKTTTFSYDASGNLKTILDALGNTTTFAYDGFGQLSSKTDARGDTTTFSYDSSGNLTRITDVLGHSTTLNYDGIGRLTSITDPNGHTATAAYDALSRLVRINDPLGNQTKFAYDPVGNLLKITDANGNATRYAYDAANNLASVTDALSHITRYAYDANNSRVTFTNAKGNATQYVYDAINRLTRITDPLSFATSYDYDAVGNVLTIKDAKGQTNQFTYDAMNRLLGISYADGKNVAYSYDPNGNRATMVDSHGTTTYSYDALDRLISVSHPGGKVVTYAYDAVGNRKSLTYPDSKAVNYTYDGTNRLASVTDWLGRTTTYAYDAASNLTSTTYPNRAALAFAYDAANRLTEVRNLLRRGEDKDRDDDDKELNPIERFTYALDRVGNRLQVTDGSGKVTRYGYDPLYQLISVAATEDDKHDEDEAKVTRFAYDAVGNRVSLINPEKSINYTYDAADRLLTANTSTFTYDTNGNQTSVSKTATGKPIIYRYDAANRLISVTGGRINSSFAYDGDGNRISQAIASGTFNYANDVATALPVVLQESGPDGEISYAYGLGLISESSAKFDFFYHYDGLGSVVGLTDPRGRLKARFAYDAWGQSVRPGGDDDIETKNKFRFTGEALDPGTQLYYLRARYYDASLGRFISRDPFSGLMGSPSAYLNRYLYSGNSPVNNIDPSGFSFISTISDQAAAAFLGGVSALGLSATINVGGYVDLVVFFAPSDIGPLKLGSVRTVLGKIQSGVGQLELVEAKLLNASVAALEGTKIGPKEQQSLAQSVVDKTKFGAFLVGLFENIGEIGNLQSISANGSFGQNLSNLGKLAKTIGDTLSNTVDFIETIKRYVGVR